MGYYLEEVETYLFNSGSNAYTYRILGCHKVTDEGKTAHRFATWAPRAHSVSVIGDFNNWNPKANPMTRHGSSGIWQTHIADLQDGDLYKYAITTAKNKVIYKADPFANAAELRPGSASKIWSLEGYSWKDQTWQKAQQEYHPYDKPISIYEVHIGSWCDKQNYREIANELAPYVKNMGYTHVELMPIAEYPYDASWGYQVTGYFATTARYGTPQDFMYFVDTMHKEGIGVILDWVPAHFPRDDFGLRLYDGSACFEHPNPLRGEHPDWGTMIFDYSRGEVVSFLMSSAVFWLDVFHIDGLRTDAVSSMLYLDYSRKDGEWLPNQHGGKENLDAIEFLRKTSEIIFRDFPGTLFCAEESTSWPLITKPAYIGGVGFNYKWNMGWMHDMLEYMSMDPIYRKHHHGKLTFSMFYAFSENYILPISHDEVVHGKKPLIDKMFGSYEQKFASMRTFLAFMFAHPGKKLMFMGAEIGEFIEWRYYEPLEWHLLENETHHKLQDYVRALNKLYKAHPALYEIDDSWDGFEWLNVEDDANSIIALARHAKPSGGMPGEMICCIFNFTPVYHENYRLGVSKPGCYQMLLQTDDTKYGGNGVKNTLKKSEPIAWNGRKESITLRVPPLSAQYFVYRSFTEQEQIKRDLKILIIEIREAHEKVKLLEREMKARDKDTQKAQQAASKNPSKETRLNAKQASESYEKTKAAYTQAEQNEQKLLKKRDELQRQASKKK